MLFVKIIIYSFIFLCTSLIGILVSKKYINRVIERYKEQDTWPTTTNFSQESFNHLQEIMEYSNQLDKKVPYKDLMYER